MGKYEEIFRSSIHRSSAKNEELIKFDGNEWRISNPVVQEENFAERWHENNHARAEAFFEWVRELKYNFLRALESQDLKTIKESLEEELRLYVNENMLINLGFTPQSINSTTKPLPPIHEVVITNPIKPYLKF